MKKILLFIMCLLPLTAFGVDVCVKNKAYVSIFRPNVNGTSKDSDSTDKVWKVEFDYRTITGNASCNEICSDTSANITCASKLVQTNLYTTKDDIGKDCWCQMWPVASYFAGESKPATGPSSYWLFLNTYSDAATCASSCTNACADAVMNNTDGFRAAMFEAMW